MFGRYTTGPCGPKFTIRQAAPSRETQQKQPWLLAQPQVSYVISDAPKVEHVWANAAAGDWALTKGELEKVNTILKGGQALTS